MKDYSKLCNTETDLFGNKYKNSDNLIIIKIFNKFLCFTRSELKFFIENPFVEYSYDGAIIDERRLNKEFYYILPYFNYCVDNSLLSLFNNKNNTMELVEKIELKEGMKLYNGKDKIYKIYKVIPISRKNLFYGPETFNNEFNELDNFNDSEVIDETEEFVVSNEKMEEMNEYSEKITKKFKKDQEERKERHSKLILENKQVKISNDNEIKTIILKETVEELDIKNCRNLESLILNKNLLNFNIENCDRLNSIVFGNKLDNINIKNCPIENIEIESKNSDHLFVSNCNKLNNINIKNIKRLSIYNCSEIKENNIFIESKEELEELELSRLNIKNIPEYNCNFYNMKISECKNIEYLDTPRDVNDLGLYKSFIKTLNVRKGDLSLLTVDDEYNNLENISFEESKRLQMIFILSEKLEHITGKLPNSIIEIQLECPNLKELPNIPTNLKKIILTNCNKLIIPESINYTIIRN